MALREVKISGVGVDPQTNMHVVLLKDKEENVVLPIMVGIFEASSIVMSMEGIKPPRPLTHDLLRSLLSTLDIVYERMIITELKEYTYYAELVLKVGGQTVSIDSRPSDAIALAVRTGAPIFVEEKVLDEAAKVVPEEEEKGQDKGKGKSKKRAKGKMSLLKPLDDEEAERLKNMIADIRPEDIIK